MGVLRVSRGGCVPALAHALDHAVEVAAGLLAVLGRAGLGGEQSVGVGVAVDELLALSEVMVFVLMVE